MPAWSTVHRWMDDDEEFTAQITRAREAGYLKRADDAVESAKAAPDAALGRLALDAERWYLGKLSNAFSDTKTQKHEHDVKLEAVKRVIYDPRNPDSEGVPARFLNDLVTRVRGAVAARASLTSSLGW
jgi:hypothetical protein